MSKKRFKILISFVLILYIISMSLVVNAAEYGNSYPNNTTLSGGAYIEAQSSIGTVTFVFPINFKDDTFGFSGNGISRVTNLTNSTIYGYVYLSNGSSYRTRVNSFDSIEYNRNDSSWSDYEYITINQIINTNINFIDYTDQNRQTDFQSYDFTYKDKFFFSFLLVIALGNGLLQFIYYMRLRSY